jgi:translation initiation factor 6
MYYKQTSVNGEDFIGMLGLATDKYAIISNYFKEKEVLEVPTIKTNLYGTNLIGMFCRGNACGLLVPYFIEEEKIRSMKKALKDHKLDVEIGRVDDTYTALGNFIVCNDKAAIISPALKHSKIFEDILGVEVVTRKIAGFNEIGSACTATNKGFLAHPNAKDELDDLAEILKVKGGVGTINFGYPFVSSGLIANSNGYATGLKTSGVELGKIDDALGFMQK